MATLIRVVLVVLFLISHGIFYKHLHGASVAIIDYTVLHTLQIHRLWDEVFTVLLRKAHRDMLADCAVENALPASNVRRHLRRGLCAPFPDNTKARSTMSGPDRGGWDWLRGRRLTEGQLAY